MSDDASVYLPRRDARSLWATVRGLQLHAAAWGDPATVAPDRPPLVMLHGWMDVGASFQFVVDAFDAERHVLAPDFRGFGLSASPPGTDACWFPDHLADLDGWLDAVVDSRWPGLAIDLAGHSMGGNVAMLYAGVRPGRIRRLVNLEGFGMPDSRPSQAPGRYARWLDELKAPARLRDYDGIDAVAARLCETNPRLRPDRAAWLASRWSAPTGNGTRRRLLADPAHRRVNPVLYRRDEALECWKRIAAPVLWVDGDASDPAARWGAAAWPPGELDARLAVVPRLARERLADAGHMLHHDQPEAVARHIEAFLDAPDAGGPLR